MRFGGVRRRFMGPARILDFLLKRFEAQNGMDLRQDPQAMQRLLEACEKAKVELSSLNEAPKRNLFVIRIIR